MSYLKDSVTVRCRMDYWKEKTFQFGKGDAKHPILPRYCEDSCGDERCKECAKDALAKLAAEFQEDQTSM